MRYVVCYQANARGQEALNLSIALARRQEAELEIVLVLPEESPFGAVYPPAPASLVQQQAERWLAEALAMVPSDVPARAQLRHGESEAEALIAAAEEFDAALLVIGAASHGLFKRFTVGSTASSLLHAAKVPVALVPQGYQNQEAITRMSAGIGSRAGADEVLELALDSAQRRGLPLRLISLLPLDGVQTAARENLQSKLNAALDSRPELNLEPEVVVAQGDSIEQAIDALSWEQPGEILLIGSSRLAPARSLFLGSTAQRILRALPVPMIVLPRGHQSRITP
ncbi:universal stress protein [Psychromicrobium lacuslunae]|uniref:Universal stress protein UspA n=1 Tax=Psychromicrobium lacuslunae TaxID=1618207 RepID=A0A0D4C0R0_9MICC|nr:universal stress protein [Psychromicrobium lacuslunae]AJT42168.1 universal stress protein UspA [Psychromicrobium lacuslunae]